MGLGGSLRSFSQDLLLGFIIALTSGVISGSITYATLKNQNQTWIDEKYFSVEQGLIKNRFDVINDFTVLYHKTELMKTYELKYSFYIYELNQFRKNNDIVNSEKLIHDNIELVKKYAELKSEYVVILLRAGMIFGPETRASIDSIMKSNNPNFWNADQQQIEKVILNMIQELTYGTNETPVKSSNKPNNMTPTSAEVLETLEIWQYPS